MKYNKNKFLNRVEAEIRNAVIVAAYDVMVKHTELSYSERVEWLGEQYHLSVKRIEQIINESKDY